MASAFLAPNVIKRISKELHHLASESPEGIKIIVNEEDIGDVQAWVLGPDGTPYENGCFRIKVVLGADFPSVPPKCFFITKIFHPNVSKTGEVCVNTLKKDWKQEHGIAHILLTVKCLLIYPNPESALNEEAGKLLLEAYDDYARHARLMTSIHAQAGRTELPPKRTDLAHEIPEKDSFKERRPVVARKIAKDSTSAVVESNTEIHSGSVISGKILSSSNPNVVHTGSATVASSTSSKKVNLSRVIIESDAPKKMEGAKRKAKDAGGGVGKEVSERKRALKRL